MKILLTNDDGISAPGISALAKRLSSEHEVYVVAPESNRSGASCSITVCVPLRFSKVESAELPCAASYSLSGSPVDCTLNGITNRLIPDIDVVISGINNGPNIGTDVVYSGTCGAARCASLNGIPGIALSVDTTSPRETGDDSDDLYYDSLADFTARNLDRLIELCGQKRNCNGKFRYDCFVNVNSPLLKNYRGVEFSKPCMRRYFDSIKEEVQADGTMTDTIVGDETLFNFGDDNSDFAVTNRGCVSISSVYAEVVSMDLSGMENSFIL